MNLSGRLESGLYGVVRVYEIKVEIDISATAIP
jgi:hypothetical protein